MHTQILVNQHILRTSSQNWSILDMKMTLEEIVEDLRITRYMDSWRWRE